MTNTKKKHGNKMKLMSAIGMLTVSAAMLVSSTFAWFSMNKKVTAGTVSLQATVPQQLLIKGSANGAIYKSAIDFTSAADSAVSTASSLESLYPVAYKSRTASTSNPNNTFKKLLEAKMNLVDADGKVSGAAADLTDTTTYTAATANTDYFYDNFTVKYAGELNTNIDEMTVTITVTDPVTTNPASSIVGALHVVLVDNASTPNVYEFDMSNAAAGSTAGVYTLADQSLTTFTSSNQEINYTVYLYYDGEDADCKNSNAVNMDNYQIAFEFNLVDATPAP